LRFLKNKIKNKIHCQNKEICKHKWQEKKNEGSALNKLN